MPDLADMLRDYAGRWPDWRPSMEVEDRRDEDPNTAALRAFQTPYSGIERLYQKRMNNLPAQTNDPLAVAAGYNQIRRK